MQSNAFRAGLLVAFAAAAVVLFIVLSGDDDSDSGSEATTQTGTAEVATAPTASIAVEGGQPVDGVKEIEVTKGDRVRLEVTSDAAGEVHVHGYEIEKEVKAGGTVEVSFPADLDGVFEVELHLDGSEAQIAELTVQPG